MNGKILNLDFIRRPDEAKSRTKFDFDENTWPRKLHILINSRLSRLYGRAFNQNYIRNDNNEGMISTVLEIIEK